MTVQQTQSAPNFGPNEWLVQEKYQEYLADPDSVDAAWHEFFADYAPSETEGTPARDQADAPPADAVSSASAPPLTSTGTTSPSTPPAPAPVTPTAPPAPAPAQPAAAAQSAPTAAPAAPAPQPAAPAAQPAAPAAARPAAPKATAPSPAAPAAASGDGATRTPIRGMAKAIVTNMAASLAVPTATSVRAVPAKLLIDNRTVINRHLARGRGGKVSFTHLIGYALVKAVGAMPAMNSSYVEEGGKAFVVTPEHVNLGLAIDLSKPDGSRTLVVPSIKAAERMDFLQFWSAYEDIVRKARGGKLTADDYAGTTMSLTNPGTIGTVHSVPRLMQGQGAIIGVGAMEYPAEFQGASPATLAKLAVSKIMTVTSTYDHRIIQGAQSGDFLRRVHHLLLGEEGFYDEVFAALGIPYEPIQWVPDFPETDERRVSKEARVHELIHAYRVRGHLMADVNPLEFRQRSHPDLDVINHGLTLWDLDREFRIGGFSGSDVLPLREVLGVLRESYCRTIGIEYMHIQEPEERRWIQARVEKRAERPDRAEQLHVLKRLNAAEAFESFLQTKYVGQKRFSLEGGESVVPILDAVVHEAAKEGLDEVVIGMAHRGRLNVLANIVGKSYSQIFGEFEGNVDPRTAHGSGDVKYHLGAEGTYRAEDGTSIAVSLASNPSHLETVDPVLEGVVRAKQDVLDKGDDGFTVVPVLVHGDAAFAGQGVVAETLNLSQLRGYRTGGTVHVIINNQVGFTTSPKSARSSVYASDVARMVQAPILHVNGDDPEACVRVAKLAYEYRQAFHKDVVIDMVCYRRRGHSEVDEPSFTQPLMYDLIDKKRSVRKIYTENLIGRGDITLPEAEEALKDYQGQLEKVFADTRNPGQAPDIAPPAQKTDLSAPVETAISQEVMKRIADSQVSLPEGFTVHPRLLPQLQKRAAAISEGGIDWATGEALAFGSLLLEGRPVRLAGQDARRGTFGQRHAVIVDRKTGAEHTPLANLSPDQATFYVYDSLLSEYAAQGFEYGYSVARPDALVLWEAQFGDFVNGAQIVIDEYIAAGDVKWGQKSGVVLLLPHGYEGQGPDHSSARIERFLTLCAEDNMTVAYPSTPASYFHLLRRQAIGEAHKPMVVFTPKSMLRLRAASSVPEDFTQGRFAPVIDDPNAAAREAVQRVVLCAGKIYHDLAAAKRKRGSDQVALVRVEQLYPLPGEEVADVLASYPNAKDVVWTQEEPGNMGPWPRMALDLPDHLGEQHTLRRISRRASASPAVGSAKVHEAEQAALVDAVFSF